MPRDIHGKPVSYGHEERKEKKEKREEKHEEMHKRMEAMEKRK